MSKIVDRSTKTKNFYDKFDDICVSNWGQICRQMIFEMQPAIVAIVPIYFSYF